MTAENDGAQSKMTFERYDANRPLAGQALSQALALLEEAFPEEERRETAAQRALLESGSLTALAARDAQGNLTALMTLWPLSRGLFLEHFAVDAAARGKGLGGDMLEALKARAEGRLVLEAEPPVSDWAVRRLAFYARHGLTAHEYPYSQPPYRPGGRYVPLRLLSCPPFASREDFEQTADEIYCTVYGRMR